MFEALKSLSPKQRFTGFIIVVLISAVTSLGTAYMSGSDCTEVSDKYTKSIENYNKLIEITDETQQKYLDAKKDIVEIQDKLLKLSEMIDKQSNKSTKSITKNSYENDFIIVEKGDGSTGVKSDDSEEVVNSIRYTPPRIIKEKTIITKTEAPKGAKSTIDSLINITKKYDRNEN